MRERFLFGVERSDSILGDKRNSGGWRCPWIFRLYSGYRWSTGRVRGVRQERCQKRGKVEWTLLDGADEGRSLGLTGGRVSVLFICKTSMTGPVDGHPVSIVSTIRSVYLCHASALKMGGRNFPKHTARRLVLLDECNFRVVDSWQYWRVWSVSFRQNRVSEIKQLRNTRKVIRFVHGVCSCTSNPVVAVYRCA